MSLKQYIKVGLLGATIGFGGMYVISQIKDDVKNKKERLIKIAKQEELKKECFSEIIGPYDKQDLEKIVLKENTPIFAFNRIASDIKFIHHKYNREEEEKLIENYPGKKKKCFRYYSLQETYNLGSGLCIDGAMSFCALLSDNPEYKAKIVILRKDKGEGHAISIFKENEKYGYVSFNDPGQGSNQVFIRAKYDNFEDLIKNNFAHYDKFSKLKVDKEILKFGKGINGHNLEDTSEWTRIKPLLNERTAGFKLEIEK